MKHLKFFENFDKIYNTLDGKCINILLDVSGSITENIIENAISDVDFGDYDEINLIQFTTKVVSFSVIEDIHDIFSKMNPMHDGGTDIQPAIEYVIDNGYNKYKTFIISDFYAPEPDYSELMDYELIKID